MHQILGCLIMYWHVEESMVPNICKLSDLMRNSITALLVFMNILCDFIVFKHFIELLHTLYLCLAALYILILCHDDNL